MAGLKLYLDRLTKRVGYKKENLSKLMEKVLAFNNEKLHNAIYRIKASDFEKQNKKIIEGKRFILPDLSDVLPKRSVFAKKAAIRGKIINDNLRDKVTADLRTTLNEFKESGELPWVRGRGEKAGTLNPKLIDAFRGRIETTFQPLTKRNPEYGGIPSNIRNIAVTEVASTVNDIKEQYHDRFMQRNPNVGAFKTWVHSKDHKRIKDFREGHFRLDGKTIPADQMFEVKEYREVNGKQKSTGGVTQMSRPHDQGAPLSEIVGCMCSIVYSYRRSD
jgi:hypothetical protein